MRNFIAIKHFQIVSHTNCLIMIITSYFCEYLSRQLGNYKIAFFLFYLGMTVVINNKKYNDQKSLQTEKIALLLH